MVQQSGITYVVKHKGKQFDITKEDLKRRNIEIVREYKTADADRRGELFQEYYDLNKPFISYFPMFTGDYREEIINTFITKIPEAFLAFDEERGVDVNSYLSMYYKKHAVREFLYLLPTVQYNKFTEDADGRPMVEKAQVVSLDHLRPPESSYDSAEGNASSSGSDQLIGEVIFDEFLNGGQQDGDEQFLEGVSSHAHHFADPVVQEIIKDFESGLRYQEVMVKHGLSMDRFLSTMAAIRLQLMRILKREGKDVHFITKSERGERRKADIAKENRKSNVGGISRGVGTSDGVSRLIDWINGVHAEPVQRDEGYRPKTPISMEDAWGQEIGGEG